VIRWGDDDQDSKYLLVTACSLKKQGTVSLILVDKTNSGRNLGIQVFTWAILCTYFGILPLHLIACMVHFANWYFEKSVNLRNVFFCGKNYYFENEELSRTHYLHTMFDTLLFLCRYQNCYCVDWMKILKSRSSVTLIFIFPCRQCWYEPIFVIPGDFANIKENIIFQL
jgi:hypothetical protein